MVKIAQYVNGVPSANTKWVFEKFKEVKSGEGNTKWEKDRSKDPNPWNEVNDRFKYMIATGDPIEANVENTVREGMKNWLSHLKPGLVTYETGTNKTNNRWTAEQLHEAFVIGIFTKYDVDNNDVGNENTEDVDKMEEWKEEGFDLEGFARSDAGIKMMMQAKIDANQDSRRCGGDSPCCSGPGPKQKHRYKTFGVSRTRGQCKGGRRKSRRKSRKSRRKSKKRKSKKKKRRRKRKRTKKRRR